MSTIFNIRNLRLPAMSRAAVIVGAVVIVLAILAGFVGWKLFKELTTKTATAYFTQTLALYPGDRVTIMGVRVGSIDSIEPAGDKMRVTFRYDSKYKVPDNPIVQAVILNPSLVASRTIQLTPVWQPGQAALKDGGTIERTEMPVEYDDLRNVVTDILTDLGPTPEQPKGPFGDVLDSFAYGLKGKGQQFNKTLNSLSDALTTLNSSRGDFFAVVRSLAVFVNALHRNDQQFVALNNDLARFTNTFTNTDRELADALRNLDGLLTTTRQFLDENSEVLIHDVDNLAELTNAILQPGAFNGLETVLHALPHVGASAGNVASPVAAGVTGLPVNLYNSANPLQFICSAIQAGSRLGYQESAELCAQYLAPLMDAIKFNYLPFGLNLASTALTLPKLVAYSEERLRPPPGYKDTTVPGIFARDTLWSHGNHEPGWVVAPGMQGVAVQGFTRNMLTPESLAELMGGPDIVPPPAPPAFGVPPGGQLPGPPNSYDQNNPLPPPWYPPAPPVPPQPPFVTQVPPMPPAPVAAPVGAPAGPVGPPPPGGFPAEGTP